jgi:type IV secretory pathway VirJ component
MKSAQQLPSGRTPGANETPCRADLRRGKTRRRIAWLGGFLLGGSCLVASALAQAATQPVRFGLFGEVHVGVPEGPAARAAVLISDQAGWDARSEALAEALRGAGTFVVGVDLPRYLQRLTAVKEKCSFPAGHFEEMLHWIERQQHLPSYLYPVLIGDGAGGTFAYALDAQAPRGTFTALITLGFDTRLRLRKPICAGDAGAVTVADGSGGFRITAVHRLPNPWLPQPFAPGARNDVVLTMLPSTLQHCLTPHTSPGAALLAALDQVTTRAAITPALPADVADLPLVEVPAQGPFAGRIGVILTGDGGWAGLDIGVAERLAQRGIAVVGLNSLKFFWQTRSAEQAADALARIIGHYTATYPNADFVVLGYSFGAALAPVAINRLPEAARRRIAAQVLISPDPEAVFEIHVGDWFGATHHEGALPIAPEIVKTTVPILCVHGSEEDDSFCARIAGRPNVRELVLPGGHHYNGDYARLGAAIADALPAKRG